MLVYAGIDEAGYGPMFGPLTVGCARMVLPEYDPADGEPKMWSKLRGAVARDLKSSKGRLVVADSKKLKLPNGGARHPLTHLERGVWAFGYGCRRDTICWPTTDSAFFDGLSVDLTDAFESLPWYCGPDCQAPVATSVDELSVAANALRRALERNGVSQVDLTCRLLTEPEFNERVERYGSKAAANFALVGRHLRSIMAEFGDDHPRVVVDRQGGRSQYVEPLAWVFPDAEIRILGESPSMSCYEVRQADGRRMNVIFKEDGDADHFPVALASMIAKYVRELLMLRFNRFFRQLNPELKPTAGYYGDGARFLRDIEPLLREHRLDRRRLVRRR
ncbi:MAG: hypothetical protein ACF8PN_16280 [Phycisphaerales bacterium]